MGHGKYLYVDNPCAEILFKTGIELRDLRDEIHNDHISSKKGVTTHAARIHIAGRNTHHSERAKQQNPRMVVGKQTVLCGNFRTISKTSATIYLEPDRKRPAGAKQIQQATHNSKVGKRSIYGRNGRARAGSQGKAIPREKVPFYGIRRGRLGGI